MTETATLALSALSALMVMLRTHVKLWILARGQAHLTFIWDSTAFASSALSVMMEKQPMR